MVDAGVRVDDEGIVWFEDAAALKAIAHPARAHAIDRLFRGDPLTATQLAAEAGVTASAMSYHLRELARRGIIRRDDPAGDGRERPWRAAGRSFRVAAPFPGAGSAVVGGWLQREAGRLGDRVAALAPELDRQQGEGRAHGMASVSEFWLTPDESEALIAELGAVLERYDLDRTPTRHPADAIRFDAWAFVLPEAQKSLASNSRTDTR